MKKYVFAFEEGNGSMRELLGGKGANLAEMTEVQSFAACHAAVAVCRNGDP